MGEVLASSAEQRLKRCQHDLTLELFLQTGPFWEAIAELRARWAITTGPQLPPRISWVHCPPACPESEKLPDDWEDRRDEDWSPEARRWTTDLRTLHDTVLPPECRMTGRKSAGHWMPFLAACVLFDPPREQLLEFADHVRIAPETFSGDSWVLPASGHLEELVDVPHMVAPPIVRRDPDHVDQAWRWFTERLINELHLHFSDRDLDIRHAATEVLRETGLWSELNQRLSPDSHTAFIQVTPTTTEADVLSARRLIAHGFEASPKPGAPSLDKLKAVQCAILRGLGWTEAAIADRFGFRRLNDEHENPRRSNSARRHVQLGQQILAEREKPVE